MLKRLNVISVNLLLKLSHVLLLMLKHFFNVSIVSSFPFGFPGKIKPINLRNDLCMNVFEMKDISPVFRNVLNVAHHMVFGSASKLKIFGHFLNINVGILRFCLILFHTVNPDVNVTISLFNRKFSQRYIFLFTLFPLQLSPFLAKSFSIFGCSHL